MLPKTDSAGGRRAKGSTDLMVDVWPGHNHEELADPDERQSRERLAEYFALLREWDLKLRRDDSDSASTRTGQ